MAAQWPPQVRHKACPYGMAMAACVGAALVAAQWPPQGRHKACPYRVAMAAPYPCPYSDARSPVRSLNSPIKVSISSTWRWTLLQ